jgi:hypothetical protein
LEKDFPDWNKLYNTQNVETMPWYNENLDSDLKEELESRKISKGRILDLGTGPATQAIQLAKRGLKVTGSDVFDRGCFHVLPIDKRPVYIKEIKRMLDDKGILFLKCFSIKEPRQEGPYKFSGDGIRKLFRNDFIIMSVKDTVYQGTLDPLPRALFVVMSKQL